MSKTLRCFNEAISSCTSSKNIYNTKSANVHGAVITIGGKIVARSTNSIEPMNLMRGYCTSQNKHAEMSVVSKYLSEHTSHRARFMKNIPIYSSRSSRSMYSSSSNNSLNSNQNYYYNFPDTNKITSAKYLDKYNKYLERSFLDNKYQSDILPQCIQKSKVKRCEYCPHKYEE